MRAHELALLMGSRCSWINRGSLGNPLKRFEPVEGFRCKYLSPAKKRDQTEEIFLATLFLLGSEAHCLTFKNICSVPESSELITINKQMAAVGQGRATSPKAGSQSSPSETSGTAERDFGKPLPQYQMSLVLVITLMGC